MKKMLKERHLEGNTSHRISLGGSLFGRVFGVLILLFVLQILAVVWRYRVESLEAIAVGAWVLRDQVGGAEREPIAWTQSTLLSRLANQSGQSVSHVSRTGQKRAARSSFALSELSGPQGEDWIAVKSPAEWKGAAQEVSQQAPRTLTVLPLVCIEDTQEFRMPEQQGEEEWDFLADGPVTLEKKLMPVAHSLCGQGAFSLPTSVGSVPFFEELAGSHIIGISLSGLPWLGLANQHKLFQGAALKNGFVLLEIHANALLLNGPSGRIEIPFSGGSLERPSGLSGAPARSSLPAGVLQGL